jgi:hypothetical protein
MLRVRVTREHMTAVIVAQRAGVRWLGERTFVS